MIKEIKPCKTLRANTISMYSSTFSLARTSINTIKLTHFIQSPYCWHEFIIWSPRYGIARNKFLSLFLEGTKKSRFWLHIYFSYCQEHLIWMFAYAKKFFFFSKSVFINLQRRKKLCVMYVYHIIRYLYMCLPLVNLMGRFLIY